MRDNRHKVAQSFAEVYREVCRDVRALKKLVRRNDENDDLFDRVSDLLESLPLPSGEYAVAINRLANARQYEGLEEASAAQFELKLLLGGLRDGSFAQQDPQFTRR